MFGLCGLWDLRRMLSTLLVSIFGFFNVGLLVHNSLFVLLCLLLNSILYKHLWSGDLEAGPEGGKSNMAK